MLEGMLEDKVAGMLEDKALTLVAGIRDEREHLEELSWEHNENIHDNGNTHDVNREKTLYNPPTTHRRCPHRRQPTNNLPPSHSGGLHRIERVLVFKDSMSVSVESLERVKG